MYPIVEQLYVFQKNFAALPFGLQNHIYISGSFKIYISNTKHIPTLKPNHIKIGAFACEFNLSTHRGFIPRKRISKAF